jgi:hypothetical protein
LAQPKQAYRPPTWQFPKDADAFDVRPIVAVLKTQYNISVLGEAI